MILRSASLSLEQGGIESDDDYPYCSGVGKCFPCVPAGWNNTRCGAPPLYCNQSQSCSKKLNVSKFLPGLKIKDWIAVEKVMLAYVYMSRPVHVLGIRVHIAIGFIHTSVH